MPSRLRVRGRWRSGEPRMDSHPCEYYPSEVSTTSPRRAIPIKTNNARERKYLGNRTSLACRPTLVQRVNISETLSETLARPKELSGYGAKPIRVHPASLRNWLTFQLLIDISESSSGLLESLQLENSELSLEWSFNSTDGTRSGCQTSGFLMVHKFQSRSWSQYRTNRPIRHSA